MAFHRNIHERNMKILLFFHFQFTHLLLHKCEGWGYISACNKCDLHFFIIFFPFDMTCLNKTFLILFLLPFFGMFAVVSVFIFIFEKKVRGTELRETVPEFRGFFSWCSCLEIAASLRSLKVTEGFLALANQCLVCWLWTRLPWPSFFHISWRSLGSFLTTRLSTAVMILYNLSPVWHFIYMLLNI